MELGIGPAGEPGACKVEVLHSPAGDASAIVALKARALLAQRQQVQNALLASGTATRQILSEAERPIRNLGQELFTALLGQHEVGSLYRASAAVAAERGQRLRIVLRIDRPDLAALPWEAMYDEVLGVYVCRRDQLVRRVPVASVPAELGVSPPARVLGVVSSPRDLLPIDAAREMSLLADALAGPIGDGLVEVTWAEAATWDCLQDLLLGDRWDVLHFVGHGDFDVRQEQGRLALTAVSGEANLVEAHRFTDLLKQATPMPRLVVLNSCSGAVGGQNDLFASTAASLVRGGVSAVVAMQFEISETAGAAFARGFYRALAHGHGVDDAVSSGRIAILGVSSRTMEWLTPVLYLRGDQARLFENRPPARRSAPQAGSVKRAPDQPAQTEDDTSAERFWLVRTLTGHAGQVFGVAFSADSVMLATAGADRTVRLWDTIAGTPVRDLAGHDDWVRAVVFGPDGARQVVSAGEDGTARVWDCATGALLRVLSAGTKSPLLALGISEDGSRLVTAGADPIVRLWDPVTGDLLRRFPGHRDWVRAVAISPDGGLLATAGDDHDVRLWHPGSGECLRVLTGHAGSVRSLAFSPDGRMLATGSDDQTVRLWE